MDASPAQTLGELQRLETRIDRLDGKVDKILWANFGVIGAVVAAVITSALN